MEVVIEIIRCGCNYILWSLPLFLILAVAYVWLKPPKFLFRKLLHITAFTGMVFMNTKANVWYDTVICLCIGAVATYGILTFMEQLSFYEDFFVEKSPGEVKKNLFGVFVTAAGLDLALYLLTGEKKLFDLVILTWGFGDAMAALVGIPFGRHRIPLKDGEKSLEGSVAFFVTASLIVFLYGVRSFPMDYFSFPFGKTMVPVGVVAVTCGLFGTLGELFSKKGWDNIIVPLTIMLSILVFKI